MFEPGLIPQLAEPAKGRAGLLGALDDGWDCHEAANPARGQPSERVEECLELRGPDASLLGLIADVDLDEHVHRAAYRVRAAVQFPREIQAIHRMDPVEEPNGILGLVRLKRS